MKTKYEIEPEDVIGLVAKLLVDYSQRGLPMDFTDVMLSSVGGMDNYTNIELSNGQCFTVKVFKARKAKAGA